MNANATLLRLGVLAAAIGTLYITLRTPDAAPPPAAKAPDYFAFVRSMEGTRPDGALRQDGADHLVVDEELGHLFDYYLAGLGEKDLEAIRSEIERELDRRLAPAPAAQAKRLLASYLDYKRALVELERSLPPGADLAHTARARLAAMQQLRLRYFSAQDSAGLFGASDAYDDDALARVEIDADRALNPAQRKAKLAALDAKLAPALREQRDAPTRVMRLEESVQQLRSQGGGDNEVYRLRASTLSPQAAARLADVDREEADWKQRIGAYNTERARLANAAPDALQQLRDARFSPDEQKRLGAYE
ncbi:MAG: lipase secretion chaperone [Pseudomonadota bacterium]